MKDEINKVVTTIILGSIAASTAMVAFLFGVIAAFLWTQQHYDTITACGAVGGIFLAVALIALIWLGIARSRAAKRKAREEAEAAAAAPAWLSDPATLLMAVQVARTVGLGRFVPYVLAGAAAFGAAGLFGGRRSKTREAAGKSPDIADEDVRRSA